MSKRTRPVSLRILDKDYVIACPEDECEDLMASARYLTQRMQEVRERGKVGSTERIAVLAALNIVHEFLQHKTPKEGYNIDIDAVRRLEDKIEQALIRTGL